ncbi:MAG TPA: NAD(P)/FAD-dependent oxidoreductase [Jiangellales bacterium]|nr:NAD(P)/FAD-dependent oxidoreductase [Jiangellales bacterium]
MGRIDTVVVGGGQAGLAVSHHLAAEGVDHVVLERGAVAERWTSERWDSLRLITPRWMSTLPGWEYSGPEPDGFMDRDEVVRYLRAYAMASRAPVRTGVAVRSVRAGRAGFEVRTGEGALSARNVVVATGSTGRPYVPSSAADLTPRVHQLPIRDYRNPGGLPAGGVLVVGASSSGLAVAEELRAAGREVVLAVGRHSRLPRTYRGRDVFAWLRDLGWLAETVDEVPDVARARREPRLQLATRAGARLDLWTAHGMGIRVVGSVRGASGEEVRLADDLAATSVAATRAEHALLDRIDDDLAGGGRPRRPVRPVLPASPRTLHLRRAGISAVVWATGYQPSYPFLDLPVLDRGGQVVQRRGVTPVPGLYVVGTRFQHRRDSVFLDGVRWDAEAVVSHLAGRDARRLAV